MPTINIQVLQFRTKRQDELIAMLNDPEVRTNMNKILGKYINNFVPLGKTGKLRESMEATPDSITWGKNLERNYAGYQYRGQVYGPNIPIIRQGTIVGWYSRKPKHPTGRELGVPGEWKGWVFGYSEPGTKHHWDEQFSKDRRWKAQANREITQELKKECKRRGLKRWL